MGSPWRKGGSGCLMELGGLPKVGVGGVLGDCSGGRWALLGLVLSQEQDHEGGRPILSSPGRLSLGLLPGCPSCHQGQESDSQASGDRGLRLWAEGQSSAFAHGLALVSVFIPSLYSAFPHSASCSWPDPPCRPPGRLHLPTSPQCGRGQAHIGPSWASVRLSLAHMTRDGLLVME